MLTLYVSTFGELSVRLDENIIVQKGMRSRKNWSLLAFLLYNRKHPVPANKIIELLWNDSDKTTDPMNAIKAVLFRMRSNLNKLGENMGKLMITYRDGGYSINRDINVSLDTEMFEALCRESESAEDAEQKIELYSQAINIYRGDFLPLLSNESWVIPIAAYYQGLYTRTARDFLALLEKEERYDDIIREGHKIIAIVPFEEDFYAFLIRALCKTGDYKTAVSVYNNMQRLFFENFGIMPSEDLQNIYRSAISNVDDFMSLQIDSLMRQLRETPKREAFVCDYDVFKHLYRAQARHMVRSGDIAHVALFTVSPKAGYNLSRGELDTAMNNFGAIIKTALRRDDVVSRCSLSQFAAILRLANYENTLMLCARLTSAFQKKYPHSHARLAFHVAPVEPC